MSVTIERLVLTNGQVYQVGKPWPDAPDGSQLNVGPIFFLPETTEDADDQGDEVSTVPAQYEVWQVVDEVFGAFAATARGIDIGKERQEKLAEAMTKGTILRRTVPFASVYATDEEWTPIEAFRVIAERIMEIEKAQETEAPKDNGAQQQQTQQP